MSGHSKWSTIKRKKGAADAKRGQVFTKIGRELTMAARSGGGDQETNVRLRLTVAKARASSMPKENIERAIKRGTGELEGAALEEVLYEAYGPHGSALMIQTLTDNRNRTVAAVRATLSRHGGRMGEAGSVGWMFDHKGVIQIEARGKDPEEFALEIMDLGAEDAKIEGRAMEVYTSPIALHKVQQALEEKKIAYESAELAMVPKNYLELPPEEAAATMRLVEILEETDDVQTVFTNVDITDEVLAQLEAA
ncbi:MAG: YebC/PmpR family DNA-binding transcriptional regulator [Chloroflexi bacterium]|nr:YebC/PmpR family DNA-binding transcriptional regulator [Chloroflexota bacterium]MBI3733630.1 YebC/PmpR family DNA-binding transcriptional regulator [Chloroflexota bacterium]